jgi:hypothetical protein
MNIQFDSQVAIGLRIAGDLARVDEIERCFKYFSSNSFVTIC